MNTHIYKIKRAIQWFLYSLLILTIIPFEIVLGAGNWPGINNGGTRTNSSDVNVGNNLQLQWTYVMDPQNVNTSKTSTGTYNGSFRSKNIAIRGGRIALLAPQGAGQDFVFLDPGKNLISSFPTTLSESTGAEWNSFGQEGRDTRNGQFIVYWHANGNIYARTSGDAQNVLATSKGYQASNGSEILSIVGNQQSSNRTGYFAMNDNSAWIFTTPGGHPANGVTANSTFYMSPLDDASGFSTIEIVPTFLESHLFTWGNPFIVDGNRLYTLGPASNDFEWLGTYIMAYTVVNQGMLNGEDTPDFVHTNLNSFIAREGDLNASLKPWCAGNNEIYVVAAEAGSNGPNSFFIDFSQPLRLTGIDRNSGADWELPISISAPGFEPWYFMPQIAYADRISTQSAEYVAVMLPEVSGLLNFPRPYNTSGFHQTRISVVNATTQNEQWSYAYAANETSPLWSYHCNTNTKMLIAGDALFVAYVKTAVDIDEYVDLDEFHPLTLYIDRFELVDGTRTSSSFALGENANTIQLDDFAAVDGKLYVLITNKEFVLNTSMVGGSQILACVGDGPANGSSITMEAGNLSVAEGDQSATVTVQRFGNSATPVSIRISTQDDTAISGSDYTQNVSILTFAPGETSKQFTVDIIDDGITEVNKSFDVVLDQLIGDATLIEPSNTQVTILDNDFADSIEISSALYTVGEGDGQITVDLLRSGTDLSNPVTVTAQTLEMTATGGLDYVEKTEVITFNSFETIKSFIITINDDSLIESDEDLIIQLSTPTGGAVLGIQTNSQLVIQDNDNNNSGLKLHWAMDENSGITLSDSSGNSNVGAFQGTPTWGPGNIGTALNFDAWGELVTAAGDQPSLNPTSEITLAAWIDQSGQLIICKGSEEQQYHLKGEWNGITFGAKIDGVWRKYKGNIVLNNLPQWRHVCGTYDGTTMRVYVDGVEIGSGLAITGSITASLGDLAIAGQANGGKTYVGGIDDVRIYDRALSASEVLGLANPVIANLAPTANAGTDSTFSEGTLATLDGSASSDPDGDPITYAWVQTAGTTVSLSNSSSATPTFIAPPVIVNEVLSFQLTVSDLEPLTSVDTVDITISPVTPGSFQFNTASLNVGEGAGAVQVNVDRVGGSSGAASINYMSSDGTAVSGSDYLAVTNTLVFADGETSKTIFVFITDDSVQENDEDFVITLNNATGGAGIGIPNSTSVTINDNDGLATGLQLHWNLDENGGTTASDSSGKGHSGNFQLSPSWVPGVIGSAVNFVAWGELITVNNHSDLNPTTAISVTAWIDSSAQLIVCKGYERQQYQLKGEWNGITFGVVIDGVFQDYKGIIPINNLPQWRHVVGTYDGSTIRVYVDGVEIGTGKAVTGVLTPSAGDFAIGGQATGGKSYTGAIDDVRIYDRALSATEINSLANPIAVNLTPTANAGIDQSVDELTLVNLDGSASSDPDFDPITFLWTQTAGTSVQLSDPSSQIPSFTSPNVSATEVLTFQLTVSDPEPLSDVDTVNITVNPILAGSIQFAVSIQLIGEGDGTVVITVNRLGGNSGAISVDYNSSDTVAESGLDYVGQSGTIQFADGEISKAINISITDDIVEEGDEDFLLSLSNATGGATITTPDIITITIQDNDGLSNGLILNWAFDETTGNVVADSSGNGNQGTFFNAVSQGTGVSGSAAVFDAWGELVKVSSNSALNPATAITLAAWIDQSGQLIICKGSEQQQYHLKGEWNGITFGAKINGAWKFYTGLTPINNLPQWRHVVGTYDGSTMRVYVDGVEIGTGKAVSGILSPSSGDFVIGGQATSGKSYMGSIDDVRVYNRALNSGEISALYNSFPPMN